MQPSMQLRTKTDAPFLALGRMDGGEDQVVLVEERHAGLVAGRVGRVEGQLGQEALARGVAGGDLLELQEVGARGRARPRACARDAARTRGAPARARPASRARRAELDDRPRRSRPSRRPRAAAASNARSARAASGASAGAVEDLRRGRRPDAGQELEDAEAGDAVARVLGEAQERQHVLDVGGVEELQPANLTKGMLRRVSSISSGPAMVRGAEEHGLRLEGVPASRLLEHALDDVARLVGLVADGDEARPLAGRRGPTRGPW